MNKITKFFRSLKNAMFHGMWTDCKHEWQPSGYYGQRCDLCGINESLNS